MRGRNSPSTCRSSTSPRPEGLPQLLGEEFWLLERGEVPALVELIPVEQVGPQRLSPGLWRAEYFVRKHRRGHWQFDPSAGQARLAGTGVLPVDAGRRRGGAGEPVETDIVEHCIDGKLIFRIAVVIGPGLELLVNPQRLARGRVSQWIANGLRTRPLFAEIAALVIAEQRRSVDGFLLGRRGLLRQLFGKDELPVHMGRDQTRGPLMRQCVRYARPPIASLRYPALVAKAWHQRRPSAGYPVHVPARLDRLVGEGKAWERRHDHMERVLRPSPVAGGIAERADDLHELNDRSRPSVRENDRQRVLLRGTHMDEMNANPVNLGAVLWEGVEASLEPVPVVLVAPVSDQRLSLLEGYALRPVTDGFPLRPPRGRQPKLETVECLLRYLDLEYSNVLRRRGKYELRSLHGSPLRSQRPKARWDYTAGNTGCRGRTYE